MTDLVLALLVGAALLCAWWLLRDLRTVPREGHGRGHGRDRRQDAGAVAVVVPARDEEATLPALLASLPRSATPAVGAVVVVDDGSQDATAAVSRRGGAEVVAAGTPPTGWTGKAWACWVGARSSDSDLILFLDADTVLEPGSLDGLLELHDRHGGLVSVQPFHTVVRPYEQLSAYFNVVALMGSGAFRRAVDPDARPMAFGPCLLTSRADYDRVGGHEAVRAEILDDVRLAEAYARAGLPVLCAVGGESVRMRSYPGGLRQLVAGWSKNMASGASATSPGPGLGSALWVSAHHAVAVGGLLALVDATIGAPGLPVVGHPLLWALAWVAVAAQLRSVLRRTGSFRWWTWALFPVPLLAFDAIFARSAVQTGIRRSVRWRGREVPLVTPSGSDGVR